LVLAVALTGCASVPLAPAEMDGQVSATSRQAPPAVLATVEQPAGTGEAEPPVQPPAAQPPSTAGIARAVSTESVSQPPGTVDDDKVPAVEETKPTKPIVELRGRIEAEAALVNQSTRNTAIIGPIDDAVGFRRARLGAQGTVGEQVRWVAEFDFAGGNVAFRDVYVAVTNLPVVRELRVGNFLEPFSLEGATSSNYMPFVERSAADVFDPAHHWGAGMFSYTDNERMTFQAGVFRSGSNNTGNDITNSRDLQYTARVTALPWYDPSAVNGPRLFQIGGVISQQYAKDNTITYNLGPQSSLLTVSDNPGSPFEPTITIIASQQQLYNVQTALVLGPLSFQAEWNAADIEQLKGGPVFFHGEYVQASYFLTGEHREYLTKEGWFGGVQVNSPFWCWKGDHALARGPGAWEVTARFAYVNFTSPNLPPTNGLPSGSRDAEVTAGINWYLNDNTRFMFNWVHAVPVVPALGPSFANAFFISSQIFW
jgi:phosphate-selective porin OprO/OprP